MAELTNFTVERDNQTHETNTLLHCSVKITGEVHDQLIFIPVMNGFLSIIALLGNTLILVARRKELASLQATSKLLYRNLAITDLGVGMVVVPLRMAYWISVVTKSWDICYYTDLICYAAGYVICVVSLSTLTVISVDRLLALKLGLRYKQVVTYKRMRTTVFAIWIQVTLVLCYLPAGLAAATTPQTGITVSRYLAREILSCLIFLNSSLNPLLYCWKIREVRQAVKDTVNHLFSSSG